MKAGRRVWVRVYDHIEDAPAVAITANLWRKHLPGEELTKLGRQLREIESVSIGTRVPIESLSIAEGRGNKGDTCAETSSKG